VFRRFWRVVGNWRHVVGGLEWLACGSLGLVSMGVKKGLRFWTVVRVLVCFEVFKRGYLGYFKGLEGSVLYNIGCCVIMC